MDDDGKLMPGRQETAALRPLETLEQGASPAEAMAFFDSLPPVALDEMNGVWRGRGLPTGHPFDGLLERFGWHGKRFGTADVTHPLLFDDGHGGVVSINPALIPIRLLLRFPSLVNTPVAVRLFRFALPLLRTRKPAARLRMTQYRGVLTATMIYDALPINDVFRKVDDDIVLGVMDLRGMDQPFVFTLRRERPTAES